MAEFAAALLNRMAAAPDVAALAGRRIYWAIRPQGSALPAIRLQTIADERPQTLKGYDGARVTLVQADCMAMTYLAASTLAEAVIAAVALPATVGAVRFGRGRARGPRDLGEETAAGFVHRLSLDLAIEHGPA